MLKYELVELIIAALWPLQARDRQLAADVAYPTTLLATGMDRVLPLAEKTLMLAKERRGSEESSILTRREQIKWFSFSLVRENMDPGFSYGRFTEVGQRRRCTAGQGVRSLHSAFARSANGNQH